MDISVEQALARILAACPALPPERVAVDTAERRVLARDVVAPHSLPPFANAGMDGFAVRAADLASASDAAPVTLPVRGAVQAGASDGAAVLPGTTVRIMTGAPVPEGTEAVVPIELTTPTDQAVTFYAPIPAGRHVRPAGEDVAAGAVAIPAGRLLRAAEIGLLAALGVNDVLVHRRPKVAIISTGDELAPPGSGPLAPGQIRDANSPALRAFVREQDAEPLSMGIARDTHTALQSLIDAALADGADLILTSAGASAGDYDIVSGLMRETAALELWRVNLKPGRPLLFGRVGAAGVPLIGLPGNPASALIVATLFVRPALAQMQGRADAGVTLVRARLDADQHRSERRHYVRARLEWGEGGYHATTHGIGGGSGALTTLVRANALLIIPEGAGTVVAGSLVDAVLL